MKRQSNIEDIYPLSPVQEGILFHSLYAPASGMYVEQLVLEIEGVLDKPVFERAWQQVIERHPILRTAFVWEKRDKPLQVVLKCVNLPLQAMDWRKLPKEGQQQNLAAFLQADRTAGFEFSQAPLMRLAVMQTADAISLIVATFHHIIKDGWSGPLILRDVFSFYETLQQGQDVRQEPPRPYRDYITWLQKQDLKQAELFWRHMLKGVETATPFAIDNPLTGEGRYSQQHFQLSTTDTTCLVAWAKQNQLTLNSLVQGAWALLLSFYSGETEVVFGITVSGRPPDLIGANEIVGLFINTLPLRVAVPPRARLLPWLRDLQTKQHTLHAYEYSPLVNVQGWSDVPRGRPLFESILVFENYPVDPSLLRGSDSLRLSAVRSIEQTNYPLTVVAVPGAELMLMVDYEIGRFDVATTSRLLGHLSTMLLNMVDNAEKCLVDIPILTKPERYQLLEEWNHTQQNHPIGCPLHHLFEAQVRQTPDNIALVFQGQQLTYRQLDGRANQLAHFLQKQGVGPETRVGICLERSFEMIIALWGVWKAGGAFIPLDPTYPPERLAFMLQDTQAAVLLTQNSLVHNGQLPVPPGDCHIICLDAQAPTIAQESVEAPSGNITGDHLAYIIYTSGSTGKPKGILMPHHGLGSMAYSQIAAFAVGPGKRVLQAASFSFDVSLTEVLMALLSGGTLVLAASSSLLPGPTLAEFLQQEQITTITLTPSILSTLPPIDLPDLQTLIVVGETCPADLVKKWGNGRSFVIAYGPSETVCATIAPDVKERLSVGRPMANTQIYVLDAHLRPLPIGVPGEIYVGSLSMARGYYNLPRLTAETFIPNPFLNAESEIMNAERPGTFSIHHSAFTLYKTGDLGRYLPDGNLEFLGRVDNQVKVHGVRIEPEEIEVVLRTHPTVQECNILLRADPPGEKRLVAYVVSAQQFASANELREFLGRALPTYMIPGTFVFLDEMPLSPNGKIDRRALPAPVGLAARRSTALIPPRTPDETRMARIWAEVLQLETVGVEDNFFDLGGHSLLATQVVSRTQKVFQVNLPIRALFETQTVARLTAYVQQMQLAEKSHLVPPIERVSRQSLLPLSFAQERLWFLTQLMPGNPFYNVTTAVSLTGSLDRQALEQSLNHIIHRHETLRTTFDFAGDQVIQIVHPVMPLKLAVIELPHLPSAEQKLKVQQLAVEQTQEIFDLTHGPLLRVTLLQLDERSYHLFLTIHHIASDGWSMGVLVQEIAALYGALIAHQTPALPPLPIQYADYAIWQRNWLQGEVLDNQMAYWRQQLSNLPVLNLPTDLTRPLLPTFRGKVYPFTLFPWLTHSLKALSQQEGASLFMVLLAAFQVLLYRYTGQLDVVVGSPIANRNRVEVEALIGFFVNTVALRTNLSGQPSFREVLKRVREVTLEAYAHQDLPFEKVVEALQPERDLSRNPLFQVVFAHHATMPPLVLPDLTLNLLDLDTGTIRSDLELHIWEENTDTMRGFLGYSTDLFEPETIARLVEHFQTLLTGAVSNPEQAIEHLPLLTDLEQKTLQRWNETTAVYPQICCHHLFEAQVDQTPDAVAVIAEGVEWSYGKLNGRANQLAHYLQKLGVGHETLVGLCVDRSVDMIIGVLGILKAGGAYVPLDPTYPAEQLSFMVADSQTAVLLTQSWLTHHLPAHHRVLCLDTEWPSIAQEPTRNPMSSVSPDNLAYVIYTSGTTGRPKGVLVPHQGLANVSQAQINTFDLQRGDRVLQFASLSFDASIFEIVMAWCAGATLCLGGQESRLPGAGLNQFLRETAVTLVTLPPSALALMPPEPLPDLKIITVAGEACPAELLDRWANGRTFFNLYGPTETTIWATVAQCTNGNQSPPIGRPILNTRVYLLDAGLYPVPVGVPGELYIGGVGVTRGYLNHAALTAERFIPDPFRNEPGARLYKTGDLARYLPDGNIEFLGRLDHQVKVRGFRVELGGIETVLKQYPSVQDSLVIAREDTPGNQQIVAYLVAAKGQPISVAEVRRFVQERLPVYMIPNAFMVLESIPLSPNGKIDRRRLPVPNRPVTETYLAPRSQVERTIAAIWQAVLGIDRVGVSDLFFEVGGHSLLLVQLHKQLAATFPKEISLSDLFKHTTIAAQARYFTATEERKEVITNAQTYGSARRASLGQRRHLREQQ